MKPIDYILEILIKNKKKIPKIFRSSVILKMKRSN